MKFLNRIGFTALPVRCVDTCKSIKMVEVYCQKVLDKYVVAFTCLFSCTEVFERKLKLVRKGYSSDCLRWSLIKFHNSLLILILSATAWEFRRWFGCDFQIDLCEHDTSSHVCCSAFIKLLQCNYVCIDLVHAQYLFILSFIYFFYLYPIIAYNLTNLIAALLITFVIFGRVDGIKCHCIQLSVFTGHFMATSYTQ